MTRTAVFLAVSFLTSAHATLAAEGKPATASHRGVDLPSASANGQAKEMKVLLDAPGVKIAAITLRGGTVLEEHSAPVPVTIQALKGTGTVRIGEASEKVGPDRLVYLAPGVPHSVVPDKESDLVLLVHHLKTPR